MNVEPPRSVASRLADLLRARQAGGLVDNSTPGDAGPRGADLDAPQAPTDQTADKYVATDSVSAEEIMLRVARAIRSGQADGATPLVVAPTPQPSQTESDALELSEWRVESEDKGPRVEATEDGDPGGPPEPAQDDDTKDWPEGLSEALAMVAAEDAALPMPDDLAEVGSGAAFGGGVGTPADGSEAVSEAPWAASSYLSPFKPSQSRNDAGSQRLRSTDHSSVQPPDRSPIPPSLAIAAPESVTPIAVIANPYGIRVPDGPALHPRRIARIAAGTYEPREIDGALAVVTPADVVLDLGAGIGLVGAAVARAIAPRKVIAVDPHPDLAAPLAAIYARNGLAARAQVWQGALLADGSGAETDLFLARDPIGSTTCGPADGRRLVSVPSRPFAGFCVEHEVTVLLADMNGAELDLLRSADLSPLRALVVGFHPRIYGAEGMREAKDLIRAAGFTPLNVYSTRLVWTCTRAG